GAGAAEFVALVKDNANLPHATSVSGGDLAVDGKKLVHHAFEPGDYNVTLDKGKSQQFTVATVPDDIDLTDGWDLSLESWGPDAKANLANPALSAKNTVEFSDVTLGDWANLPVTDEQLADLGVGSIDDVSGIGTYSTSFILGDEWAGAGAILQLSHGAADMIAEVMVNQTVIDDIDQLSNSVDLSKGLKVGLNRITVKLDTSLQRRFKAENPTSGGIGNSARVSSGLTAVSLDAYRTTKLSATTPVEKQLTNTALPAISGSAKVGSKLTVSTGSWSPQASAFSYQWLRDGASISGATKSSYTLVAADAGHRISATVTASLSGYSSTSATSAAVSVAKGTIKNTKAPKISGTAKVGKKLTVSKGSWSPKPAAYSY
ncbi:MAG: hypothetical protein KIT69_21170, partial [Propionibacteriaceae bacterium]|nr:hypothetical protein [Propionibacteriaceae bacterium]